MYLIKSTQTFKKFLIKDITDKREYIVMWDSNASKPWSITDEYGIDMDQETSLGEDLIVMAQDQFDDWAK